MKNGLCMVMACLLVLTSTSLGELVGHWSFDEGQGDVAYDSASNNHGAVVGATWTTNGKVGGALHFDGDDYVRIADSPELDGMVEMTMAAWVYMEEWNSDNWGVNCPTVG